MNALIPGVSVYRMVLGLFSVFFLAERSYRYSKQRTHAALPKLVGTIVVWGGIFLFSFFPDTARVISSRFGLGQNLNTLIFSGFVVIVLVLFKLIDKMDRIEKNLTDLVRKEALEKLRT